ncbi:hypothetical protein [Comamonas thiooxydans]|uniref:hypothetical protein n=1 Tax=Comamonas thiooxydans TaxID=363952 RepID=UPI001553F132|nr:hypothetical protein [Comamonas thiooxydans]BDB71703.1 hypothetical protein Cthiooxydans_41150 [Comamonas thiooxydans]
MSRLPDQWTPSLAAEKAIQAAQLQAQKLLRVAAEHLQANKVPEDEVLYQLRILANPGNPHATLHLQIAWPGVLQLVTSHVGLVQSANLADADWVMRERLAQLRERCPVDRVLLKANLRRPHSTPMKVTFDASGVLRVMHARTHKLLAVSAQGAPFKLSPDFQALTFHDLMPGLR